VSLDRKLDAPMKNEPGELLPVRWTLIDRLKNWDDQEIWQQRGALCPGRTIVAFRYLHVYGYRQFL